MVKSSTPFSLGDVNFKRVFIKGFITSDLKTGSPLDENGQNSFP